MTPESAPYNNPGGKEMILYTVPEPSSFALLLLGTVGIVIRRRRR